MIIGEYSPRRSRGEYSPIITETDNHRDLLKKSIDCVQAIAKIDVTYQATRLKKRIQTRYPQLIFQLSKTMNKGTLVYADSLTAGDVADTYQDLPTLDSQSEDEDDIEHEVSDND